MKLSDLELLEQEYERRGYRVRFEHLSTTGWVLDGIPSDDEPGCAIVEEAQALLERLRKVVPSNGYRGFVVVGPDLQPVEPAISAPVAPVPSSTPYAPPAWEPLRHQPPADIMLTILTQNGEQAICGDPDGAVYLLPLQDVLARTTTKGRPKYTANTSVVGPDGRMLAFQRFLEAESGLDVAAALYGGGNASIWFVLRTA